MGDCLGRHLEALGIGAPRLRHDNFASFPKDHPMTTTPATVEGLTLPASATASVSLVERLLIEHDFADHIALDRSWRITSFGPLAADGERQYLEAERLAAQPTEAVAEAPAAAGVKAPAATPPNCCPQCMGEGWVELKRLCKKHGSGVALPTGPRNGLAQIEGDSIVIRLTADACAFAFVNDPQAQEPRPPVIDKQAFLRDTFNALTAEGEDGSTPLTDVLDKAMVRAMEDGSDALDHDAAGVAPTHGGEHG
jgi:hypothetical protein